MSARDYREVNRARWDERAPAHARSPDYAVDRFAADARFISDVVRFDAPLLGEIAGMRGVHLQCHIGTDTISLARLGAQMTGLDFSAVSLEQARALSERAATPVEFVQADVYDAADALGRGRFELVYTGIGALCWLPDIPRWAHTVAALLAPGGRLFMREGHPMMWALDEYRTDELLSVVYPYFTPEQPLEFDEQGTYVATDAEFVNNRSLVWNHGLGQIVTALLEQGLEIVGLVEHDSVPWDALPGRMRRLPSGEYRLAEQPSRMPGTYTLQARRPLG